MKYYQNTGAALVLALMLSTSAFAGEIHTGVTQPPPPPTANGVMQTRATDGVMHTDGEMHTGVAASSPTDTMTETALNLLQSLLSLL